MTVAETASAVVVSPLTVQYDKAVFGDFVIAGNVSTTCPTSAQWANPNCATGRSSNSSTLANTYINDAFYMEYVDVDGEAGTFNSSTSRITIPTGATIDYARLWWVGNTGDAVRSDGVTPYFACNASQPNTGSPNRATAPTGFSNSPFTPSTHPVKFKINGGSYQDLTPEAGHFFIAPSPTNGGRHYTASRDVKAIIAAQPTGVPIDFTVGNIWTPKGNNCAGGFALTYVWKFPNPEPTYAPQARQVLVFDGLVAQGATDPATTTNLTGFTLAAGTRRFGAGIIEGDQGITGDQVKANGVALTEPRISPATTNNYNASTVDGMQNPIYPNSLGLDAKTMNVPSSVLPDGLSNVPLTFTTSGDQYFPFLFAFSAPIVTNFLSGLVWNDADGDGVLDPGEAPIPGTTVTLTGTDATGAAVSRSLTTDAGGSYRFDGITNGNYTVTETQPLAFADSPGTTTTQYVSNVRPGITFAGAVATGVTNVNFAEIQSSLAGTVYHDQNADGAKGGAEPGIGGVTVQLTGTDVNGAAVGRTTTTAADGTYSFANVVPGTYVVTEVQPSGWGDGGETAGSSGGTTTTNDKITAITIVGGVNATGYNFGEKRAPLSGLVYVDTDNNGTPGAPATEPGIAGVTITVTGLTESGAPVSVFTTTAADGTWSFPTLLPGTYTVTETQPTTYGDGKDAVGTVNAVTTGSGANDQTTNVVLTGSAPGINYNFGELPGTISGRVWADLDRDGVLDGTETFVAGVTVTLTKPDGSTAVAVTAVDGTYSFTGLAAGSYTITETQPTGYGSSTPNSLTPVVLAAGASVTNQNFGETLSTLAGKVYVDANSSNSFTVGEDGIAGITVTLKDAGGVTVATTTTDSSGNYLFTGLLAGTYSVVETQPTFLTDAAETAGTSGGTPLADTATTSTIGSVILAAAVDATGYNFGELGANISGKVFSDLDNDGVIDVGEPGIPGVPMVLEARICMPGATIPNPGPTCGAGAPTWAAYDNAVTGPDGSYSFLGNQPGVVYRITQTQPANYADGIATAGTIGTVTNQVAPGETIMIGLLNYSSTLAASGSINNNFGELSGEISGYVYYDDENDALRTGDAAIAGTVVTVTDGTTTWTATTDAAGFYQFIGLPITAAGVAYTINETQPSAYFDGSEASTGTINPAGVNDRIAVTLTTAARVKAENNFGEQLGSIAGKVWADLDRDGVMDGGETTGIPTTITITDGLGTVVGTGMTNPDGTYSFGGLPPGTYTVTETQPTGYGSSTANVVAVPLTSVSVTGIDFGETLGSIAGSVYVDTNRNGVRDPGEGPIVGVNVTLTKPDTTTVSMVTDASGNYLFTDLVGGNYTITETQPAAYNDGAETVGTTGGTATAPDTFSTVSLDAGEDAVGYLYGELSPSVEGTVYTDQDRNGIQDPGEPGIPGVVLTITGPGGVNLTTTTDLNGDYIFPSVPMGPGYTITETQPVGYGSSEQPTNSITALNVPLAGVIDQDFGDTLGSLAGTVYVDGNDNGVPDAGEPGIAGASVTVSGLNAAGQAVVSTTTSDLNGDYLIEGLLAGTYSVTETQPTNYDDGLDAVGTVTAGPSGSQEAFAAPDRIASVTLAITDDGVNYDFGEIGTSIAGTVFRDKARDGDLDPGTDPPLSGVTVELYDSTGLMLLDTAITGADGTYLFPNLALGDYVVKETQPVGYADTIGAAGPNTRNVTAPAGGLGGIDFGETRGSIGGTVWVDNDKDGTRDGMGDPIVPAIDAGIAGVTVTLSDTDPLTADVVMVTDANGEYYFDNLPAGTYTVTETQPASHGDGADLPGTLLGSAAVNDVISGIVLPVGGVGAVYDFAEVGATVSGTVWLDSDGGGDIDPTETTRLAAVEITLDDGDPLTTDPTTTTDASGYYEFTGVPVGTFTIVETQPVGYVSTMPANDQLTATVAKDVAGVIQDVTGQNFGESLGSLGDYIWLDLDGDGVQEAGEPGLPGVTVTATATIGGTPYTFSTVTDASGAYRVADLPLGDWTVTVDPATLPGGMTATFDDDGIATANVSLVTLDATHLADNDQDFGYQGNGSIGNFVWNDLDGDGLQDVGEPGIPGVDITVTTEVAGTTLTFTTTTDATGGYSVTGLPHGTFVVTVDPLSLPAGVSPSGDADGGNDNTSTVVLDAATPTSDAQDFGYRGAGSIGDVVWLDLNSNGSQDPGEPGIPGVTLTVRSTIKGFGVPYTVITDAAGAYNLTGLPLVGYTVTVNAVSLPAGVTPTFDANGVGTPNTSPTILTVGTPAVTNQDFGYVGAGEIGDLIWNDLDGDGTRDTNEPGFPGVIVTATLTNGGLPMTVSTVTGPDGSYQFTNLPLGDWTVTVDAATLPPSMTNTGDPDASKDGTSTVTLTVGTPAVATMDFGYQGLGSIGNFVWIDIDADGTQDLGEPGIAAVDITITTTIAGSVVSYTTTTDVNGGYTVSGLPLGDFTVTVDSATLPAGITPTFDADGLGTLHTSAVTLSLATPTSDTQDFGYEGPGQIGDLIWNDLDGDGFQDAGEPGIPGVKVTATATLGGATFSVSAVTGPDGSYHIVGLPLATFTVTVDTATLPANMTQTGDPDATKNNSSTVTLTAGVPTSDTQDFGYQGIGSIGDVVWNDLDGDGSIDLGEPGLPGVTVTVTTTIAGSVVTYTTVTDALGGYTIAGLPLGDFTVTIDPASLPVGMNPTGDPDATIDGVSTVTLIVGTPTSTTQDFGYQGPGTIGNFVWNDLNADGVQDLGEPGLPGVDITITTMIAGSPVSYAVTTDALGGYSVSGLPVGDFTVTVDPSTLPASMVQSFDSDGTGTADTSAVTLTAGVPTSDTQDFGYSGDGVIGDLIWNDLDGDGTADPGEPGLPGVTVTITTTIGGQPVTYTDITDASGAYLISGLPVGDFTVTVDPAGLPAGVNQTGDPDGGNDNTAEVTLTVAAPNSDTQDFGYQGPGSIGDLIWNDLNGDGIRDTGEPGLPGVVVTLTTTINGTVVTYTATTGPTGAYSVSGLPLGDFTVTVDPTTLPPGVNNTGDPDGGNDNTAAVTLSVATPTSDTQDFGYQGVASIGDFLWLDLNGDGLQDAGEPGLPGVTVTITTMVNGSIVLYSATTDTNGAYLVDGLPLGDFTVTVDAADLPAGVLATFDSDGTGSPHTSLVTLSLAVLDATDQDFGYRGPGVIGDLIWNDLNGDGMQDPGEPGLPGVTVTAMVTINGAPVTLTTTTGPDGSYTFVGLPLGDWTVAVDPTTLPAGMTNTGDPDGGTLDEAVITLTAVIPTSDSQDFGYQGVGSIGDLIWNDLNGDGMQDPGEPGLPGVVVTLTTTIAGTPVTYTVTTDPDGSYTVDGLPLGDWIVTVDPASLPPGVTNTGDPDGVDDNTTAVTLSVATPTLDTVDFGYQGPGSIGDFVWIDLNSDGVQDAGEPGIASVDITITTTIAGSSVTYTVTTDGAGAYLVDGLPFGDFTVTLDPTTLPSGSVATFDADGIATLDTSDVSLTAAIPAVADQDFGYAGPGVIGDLIWNDLDGDGMQDPGEPGLPGVVITATSTIGGTPVTVTTTTGPDGSYSFAGLPLGDWTVTVDPASLPLGVTNTGDPDGVTDDTTVVTLTAAVPTVDTVDFGYQGVASIGDLIWNDLNGDGLQDPGEPGLPGVDITITTTIAGSPVTFTVTTDPSGAYLLDGLPFGTFTVTVDPTTLPAGVLPTGDPDGGNDNIADVVLDMVTPDNMVTDFGYQGPGAIGDFVWLDLNSNGVQDIGEPGIASVDITITTTIAGSPVTYTVTTDGAGAYLVDGLPLGDFTVTVDPTTLPAGVVATFDADGIATVDTSDVTLTAPVPAVADQDFGYAGPGVIGDLIWNDLDGDGMQDPGEPGLPGVVITATSTIGGTPVTVTVTTGPDGSYSLVGLPLGDWTVTVDPASLPLGLSNTGDPDGVNDHTTVVTLTAAVPTSDTTDFGYQGPGSLGDFVWADLNGDGVQDAGEPGLAGVDITITTTIAGSVVTYTTTTDLLGAYLVDGLPLGDFIVTVDPTTLPAGVVETFDADGIATLNTSSVTLTLVVPTADTQDFGYQGPGVIGDIIWNDLDGDGLQDPGEPGLPGVTVTVTATIGGATFTVTTMTLPDGSYQVSGLPLATYTVTVDPTTLPSGLTQTGDPDPMLDDTATVTLTAAAAVVNTVDFGYQGPGVIGDLIWNDQNGDGLLDIGEPGLPGVTLTITTTIAGSPVTYTVITDPQGGYSLSGLPLGDYTVTVDPTTLPLGVTNTGDPDGGNDSTAVVSLTAAAPTSDTQDFGFRGPGSIGNFVWNDLNTDGVQDAGEPGLPGVDVTITTVIAGSTVTYTATTDSLGAYAVAGLPFGDFTVTVDPTTLPLPMVATFDADGTGTADTSLVTLTLAVANNDTQDFGYTGDGVIGDVIWNDLDGDGVQDAGEPGLPGVTVTITTTIGGQPVTYTDVTDASGAYLVGGLPLGDFTVTVDPTTLPAGVLPTGDPDGGNDNTSMVTLTAASPSSDTQDFGYQGPGSIGDLIWNDLNGDGVQDAGEPGLPGVVVTLTTVINGTPVTYTTTTGPTGAFVIDGLPLGDFTVTVDPTTLPLGVTNTGDPDGTPDGTAVVTLTVVTPTSDTADFGYQGPASIGDFVWIDLNGDGVQDAGEPGLPGVDVTITTMVNGSIVLYSATTDATGGYLVAGLPFGDFTVTIDTADLPVGLVPTFDADGSGTPHTSLVTLSMAVMNNDAQDFGYQGPGVIGDLIWNDLNGDGVQDPGEPGLPGVTVTATATINGSPVTVAATTGPDGSFTIIGLPLGDWTVTVDVTTLPGGVLPTGDPDGTPDHTSVVALTVATPTSDIADFGYQGPGVIGNFVWTDLNGDGVQDAGEAGIPGVAITVTTTIAGSVVTYTTTTDATGGYTVSGLPLGDFTVTVDPATVPADLVATFDADGIATVNTSSVTLTLAAPTADTQDFGYQGIGAIGDFVWNDLDGDGVQDPGEPGIPGVLVTLVTTITGLPVTYPVSTGPDGSYSVTGLPLGDYTVTVDPTTLPVGTVPTFDADDPADGSLATPNVAPVTLTAGAPTSDVTDFGYNGPGSIGDQVWNDLDLDGVQDAGEPGLPGVGLTITTVIAGTTLTYPATTGPDGHYVVTGLLLGDYAVTIDTVTLPAGAVATFDGDDPADGTINTPEVSLVSLTVATPVADTQDFGYAGPGSLGDVVWNDLDGDGIHEPGEPGLPGVDLVITTVIGGVTVNYSVTTDANGGFTLSGLPFGDYTITVDRADLPVGAVPTFDGNGISTPDGSVVTLTPADATKPDEDFGYQLPSSIGDLVWEDRNGNGRQDAGEPGIAGVPVQLVGVDGLGHSIEASQVTAVDGTYMFTGLAPGDYMVKVTTPTGYVPAPVRRGTDANLDSNGISTGITVTSGTFDRSIDTGYYRLAAVSGVVYFDADGGGSPSATEPGISAVAIALTGTTGDGVAVSLTTTTGPTGAYSFADLAPGTYTVTETHPEAWADGAELPPTGATSTTNDVIEHIVVASGVPVANAAFGELGWLVQGVVSFDGTGAPVAGVVVTLRGTDLLGNVVEQTLTTTACDGAAALCTPGGYTFPNVPPGTYTLTETQPVGLNSGVVNPGDVIELVLSGGPSLENHFTEVGSSLAGVVYIDTNNNGIQDPEEWPNPDISLTLTGTDTAGNPVNLVVITDKLGRWVFPDLRAGTYTITVSQPENLNDGTSTPGTAGGTAGSNTITVTIAAGVVGTGYLFGDIPQGRPGKLPTTGSNTMLPVGIGAAGCLLGLGLLLISRRRRQVAVR